MLVLSRKISESIVIRGDIRLTVVEVRGGKVRIGIQAPPDVTVNREEVQREIDRDRAKIVAASATTDAQASDAGNVPA